MGILASYDPARNAIINPADTVPPVEGFPQLVVSTYSHLIIEHFLHKYDTHPLAVLRNSNGDIPVYKTRYKDTDFAVFMSPVGAPAAATAMEEVIAMGGRRFVYFGACGVLINHLPAGHFVVPDSAVRDEGVSFHYLPSADEILLPESGVRAASQALDAVGIYYAIGKTWTTDAIYRETRDKVERRRQRGCIVVDMECAALAAVAQFRDVGFCQFFFAEDNLDAAEWEPRTLQEYGGSQSDKYLRAGFECGIRL